MTRDDQIRKLEAAVQDIKDLCETVRSATRPPNAAELEGLLLPHLDDIEEVAESLKKAHPAECSKVPFLHVSETGAPSWIEVPHDAKDCEKFKGSLRDVKE